MMRTQEKTGRNACFSFSLNFDKEKEFNYENDFHDDKLNAPWDMFGFLFKWSVSKYYFIRV